MQKRPERWSAKSKQSEVAFMALALRLEVHIVHTHWLGVLCIILDFSNCMSLSK